MPLDWDALIILLRLRFAAGFLLTEHANQRCDLRNISVRDIKNCIMTGKIIEEQVLGIDPKILVKGEKVNGSYFYVVVALTEAKPWVITVCEIDENVWEVAGEFIRRR